MEGGEKTAKGKVFRQEGEGVHVLRETFAAGSGVAVRSGILGGNGPHSVLTPESGTKPLNEGTFSGDQCLDSGLHCAGILTTKHTQGSLCELREEDHSVLQRHAPSRKLIRSAAHAGLLALLLEDDTYSKDETA